jgi:hypothetical protein
MPSMSCFIAENHHHSIYTRNILLKKSSFGINQYYKLSITECQGASSVIQKTIESQGAL